VLKGAFMSFKVISTGSYVPERIVTNDDLATFLNTSDEWIKQRVGISERHISENQSAADMAVIAAKRALEKANIKADEIDLIIAATISNKDICPGVAATVQQKIGASCFAFDINSACSGFLFALETAAAFFEKKTCKKAIVIGAEQLSRILDWNDRSSCVIFGDGAGAVVLEAGENYIDSMLFTKGGDDVIHIPAGSVETPFSKPEQPVKSHIFMNGQETFKFAVNTITQDIKTILERNALAIDDIKQFVLHQANARILQFAAKRLNIDIEKFPMNIDTKGNTSSASIPILLDELDDSGKLKKDDLIVFSAFGGGLSGATCLLKW